MNKVTVGITTGRRPKIGVAVGTPVRSVTGIDADVNNLLGVDTTGKRDGSLFVYDSASGNFLASKMFVDLMTQTDGSVLVYDSASQYYEATLTLEKQDINGGQY